MTELSFDGATAEAVGHPTECTEPAQGSVDSDASTGIIVSVGDVSRDISTVASSSITFSSHAHAYSTEDGCHNLSSHSLTADSGDGSITVNGSPVIGVGNGVTTDPITGGNVNITGNEIQTNITIT